MKLTIIEIDEDSLNYKCKDEHGYTCYIDPYVTCALSHDIILINGAKIIIPDDTLTHMPLYLPDKIIIERR